MSFEDEHIDDLFRNAGSPKAPSFREEFWNEMEELLYDDGKGVDELFVNATIAAPPYSEAYWKEMEALLPEKKRRIAGWWYAAAACLPIALLFVLTFRDSGSATANERTAKRAEKSAIPANGTTSGSAAQHAWTRENNFVFDLPSVTLFNGRSTGKPDPGFYCSPGPLPQPSENILAVDDLPKLQTGVSYNMARAKFITPPPPPKRFYVQAGAFAGQSYLRTPEKSGIVHGYSIGGGLYSESGNFVFTFGLHGQLECVNNITVHGDNGSQTQYRQLYAVTTPLSFGLKRSKSVFGIQMTPGMRMGYSGMYISYDASGEENERSRVSGSLPQQSTLTMQLGLSYSRALTGEWMLGAGIGTDILTPFGSSSYEGDVRRLPVSGGIFLRKTF
jgi:hypothetical protein